ncbi:YbdD/YjiX family protein [Williamsia soli]|uniref:YbdD/YjiX family protein n=1 Tax=Williamsia soli TaxID=364929 RepID=UPI003556F569
MGEDRQVRKDVTLIENLRRGAGALRWYVGSVMGDNHYRRYVTHQSAQHPGVPPLSESDYWRMRYRNQDANPQGRCC